MRAWTLAIWIAPTLAWASPPSRPPDRPRPPVEREEGLTADKIHAAIRLNAKAFKHCYERELTRNPAAAAGGKIVVRFTIDRRGLVTTARIESSTTKVRALDECVVAQLRKVTFPASEGSSTVTYPFVFSQGT